MPDVKDDIVEFAKELQSIAQTGLYYSRDVFDTERYQRVRDIAAAMMVMRTDIPLSTIKTLFCSDYGYQTPKVDTRAAIFCDDKILLVHEKNGTWSLPGGWCDYNLSPVDNIKKEALEEAGLEVEVTRLVAVLDRSKHNRPLYAYNVVKIIYFCTRIKGEFKENIETLGTEYFSLDNLPELAEEKCSVDEIRMCFDAYHNPALKTVFD